MRRQRVLERVGWRFWRCFASSFYRDPDGVLNDLIEMLTRLGIQPIGEDNRARPQRRFTEHRIIEPAAAEASVQTELMGIDPSGIKEADDVALTSTGIGFGDKVVLVFADDLKRISVRVSEGGTDLEKGRLSASSPLGKAILGAEEGDEVELPLENGRQRKALIESVEKAQTPVAPVELVPGQFHATLL
jgi:Transcription elongation factor, GreA/GreB, C-term